MIKECYYTSSSIAHPVTHFYICQMLHNSIHNELNDLYSPPNVIRMIKLRRMRQTGHISHMGKGQERCIQGFGGKT